MNRRRVLLAIGGSSLALAGCFGSRGERPTSPTRSPGPCGDGGEGPRPATTARTGRPAASEGFPRLSVTGDLPPTDHEVDMRAAVRRQFDVESPAEVRVRFTNLAAAERAFWFGTVVPFLPRDVRHTELDARLQLVSRGGAGGVDTDGDGTIETLPDGPTGSCWQADDAVVFSEELRLVRLDGCETVAETFAVVAHPGNERCMPDGRYRAESSWATDDDRGGTSQAVTVEWGFTIEISSG